MNAQNLVGRVMLPQGESENTSKAKISSSKWTRYQTEKCGGQIKNSQMLSKIATFLILRFFIYIIYRTLKTGHKINRNNFSHRQTAN